MKNYHPLKHLRLAIFKGIRGLTTWSFLCKVVKNPPRNNSFQPLEKKDVP